jgi:hypothetical protein
VARAAAGMRHLAAAAAAVTLALAIGGPARSEPSRKAYLTHVSSVCQTYARRLERVPAPSDPAAFGDVISSLERVVPLLRAQERSMRAVPAPHALQPTVGRLFALDRSSIAGLESTLAAARRRDPGGVARGLVRFASARDRIHRLSVSIGIRCDPH